MDQCRDLLEETGHETYGNDERYTDIILQALPTECERVRTASYERRYFGLDSNRHMVHTMYVHVPSRSLNRKPVAGHVIAMQVGGHNGNDVKYN